MHVDDVDDNEPLRTPGAEPGSAQSIMDSFQRVLDDLDAARAELRGTGGLTGPPPTVTVEPLWARATHPEDAPAAEPPRTAPWRDVTPWPDQQASHTAPPPTAPSWRDPRSVRRPRLVVRRGRLAGVCGVGAVGGLLVVSSMLANGALASGGSVPSGQPVRPPHQDVHGSRDDAGQEGREAPRRTYRIPQLHPGDGSRGHYDIEVRAVAARFQDPPPRP